MKTLMSLRNSFIREDVAVLKYVSIVAVYFFVIMFATGPGSIPWFLVSEMFGVGARGLATSLAVACNWSANFMVFIAYLPLAVSLQRKACGSLAHLAVSCRVSLETTLSSCSPFYSSSSGSTLSRRFLRRRARLQRRSQPCSVTRATSLRILVTTVIFQAQYLA